jgi:hypothetical protein
LLNEPAAIDGATYYRVVKLLVEAIRAEDPTVSSLPTAFSGENSPATN